MLIAFESLPGNDPRLDREIKVVNTWWKYTMADVPEKKHIDWLYPIKITEEESKADIIASATNDEITVLASEARRGNLIGYSGDDEAEDNKILHVLTPQQKSIGVSFIKKVLKNFAEKQLASIKEIAWIKIEIDKCKTIDQLHIIMAQHFDFASEILGEIPQPQKKLTSWKDPEIVSLPPKSRPA
jgi:hypothetical protein